MAKGDAVKPKPTGRRSPAAKDEKPQAERFIETAQLLESDESGKAFEAAFGRLVVLPIDRKK